MFKNLVFCIFHMAYWVNLNSNIVYKFLKTLRKIVLLLYSSKCCSNLLIGTLGTRWGEAMDRLSGLKQVTSIPNVPEQ